MATAFTLALRKAVVISGMGLGLTAGAARATDWPYWRGPERSGVTRETGWLTAWPAGGLKRLWRAELGDSYATVAVSEGRVFGVGNDGETETVRCFDALTGRPIWSYRLPHSKREYQFDPHPMASTGAPVVAGRRVHLLTREGVALCLYAVDGSLLWKRDLAQETQNGLPPFGCAGAPVVSGPRVFYNVGKSGIALDSGTGSVLWNSGPGVAGHASPVQAGPENRAPLVFFTGTGLACVDVESGTVRWQQPWTSPNNLFAVDPIVSGDRLLATGFGGARLFRIGGAQPEEVWQARVLRSTFINPVLIDGFVYGSDRGGLQCVDLATGQERWSKPDLLKGSAPVEGAERPHPMGEGGLIGAGKHVIVLDQSGTLHLVAATPEAFREAGTAKVMDGPCWTAPVLANGILYCRNNRGELVAVDLRG